MKKILTIALLGCSVMMLSGCFTAALISSAVAVSKANAERNQDELYNDLSDSKKKELIKKICETYTPKNSVLVYGTWSNGVGPRTLSMIQMDKSKPAHHLEYIGSSSSAFSYKANFFFKPCIPGGRYHACYRYQYYSSKKTVTTYYGLQGTTLHDFVAPTKPGLYFYGDHNLMYDWDEYRRTYAKPSNEKYAKYEKDLKECEINSLKYMLTYYKDTAWEPVINKRLEELGAGGKK